MAAMRDNTCRFRAGSDIYIEYGAVYRVGRLSGESVRRRPFDPAPA
jgi:hypothetical protein